MLFRSDGLRPVEEVVERSERAADHGQLEFSLDRAEDLELAFPPPQEPLVGGLILQRAQVGLPLRDHGLQPRGLGEAFLRDLAQLIENDPDTLAL
mgnify:CR=1 FL=1